MTEAVKLSEGQKATAKLIFNNYDKKGEDHIKVSDIAPAMKNLGHNIKGEWLEKMEDEIDTEGTGFVDFEEFLVIVQKKMQADEEERELKDCFRILDKEKKGEVNVMELRWILKSLGEGLSEDEIDEMIADVDTDGSGWVDYEEFRALMQ